MFIFKEINSLFKNLEKKRKKFSKKFNNFTSNNKSIVKQGLLALIICAIGDLIAGIILGNMTFFLETFPGLLVIIPGAIGMRGNIFGSFSSRLNTNLHIGTLSPELKKSDILIQNIVSAIILVLLLSIILPIIAKIICIIFSFESMSTVDFILISAFSGIISCFIMLPISMFFSLKSYEHGWDPDNITTPLVTASGDLFTLPSIILSIFLVIFINNDFLKIIILAILVFITLASFIYIIILNGEAKKIILQSTPVLIFSSFLGIFSGGFLNNSSSTFLNNPTLLTLVPLFSGENGSLLSILCARLSSALHSGLIEPVLRPEKHTLTNFIILFIFGLFIYPFMALLVEFSLGALGIETLGLLKTLLIVFISGFIVITIMMVIIFYLSALSFREGLDPDNIVIPISTSLTDLVSMTTLTSIAVLILSSTMF
ncbi:magnesium transporter [Methanobrevibacter sp. DSM 116169]|uniref:magnesium transporter n=1 Tax=Methanobrevibacter sp. DSM 116169 TaxID=3242727 RepID=UPI0038FCEC37